jgi:uncharacterized membrane protein
MDQPAVPTSDETTLALLAHVLQIFTWWIGPLAIYLAKRDSKFVSFHAMQALLWQFTMMGLGMVMGLVWVFFFFLTILPRMGKTPAGNQPPPAAFFVLFPLFWLGFLGFYGLNVIFGILYGVKAWSGRVGCLSGAGAMGTPNCRALKKSKQFTWLV